MNFCFSNTWLNSTRQKRWLIAPEIWIFKKKIAEIQKPDVLYSEAGRIYIMVNKEQASFRN